MPSRSRMAIASARRRGRRCRLTKAATSPGSAPCGRASSASNECPWATCCSPHTRRAPRRPNRTRTRTRTHTRPTSTAAATTPYSAPYSARARTARRSRKRARTGARRTTATTSTTRTSRQRWRRLTLTNRELTLLYKPRDEDGVLSTLGRDGGGWLHFYLRA